MYNESSSSERRLSLEGERRSLGGYMFYTSRPTYLVKKGEEYLGRGNLDQAKQMADRLQRKGHNSAAHILRGKILLSQARAQLKNDPPPFPYEGIQRAAQTILSSVSVPAYLPVLRGPAWLSAIQVQKPFPQPISSGPANFSHLSGATERRRKGSWIANDDKILTPL